MKIFNYELNNFVDFIMSLELTAKKSRLRTRFIKLITERLKEIEEEKMNFINKYGEKNENGELKTKEEDGQQMYIIKDIDNFNKEMNELMNEELIIDETNERKDILLNLQDIILNTDKTFSGQDALIYDRWCEIVEEIKYE